MQNAYEFLNETFRSEKGEKKIFFCKLNIKDDNFFYTDIYIYDNNKNIYMLIYKKFKKMSMQLIRGKSISCLKNQVIFQSEHRNNF